jgi:hypothetical protein
MRLDVRRDRRAVEREVMVRAAHHFILQRLAHLRAVCAIDGLGIERHLRDAHADRVVDGVREPADGRRRSRPSPTPLAPNGRRTVVLDSALQRPADRGSPGFVVRERRVGHLAAINMHLLEHAEAKMHQRRARNLRLDRLRIDRLAAVDHVDRAW